MIRRRKVDPTSTLHYSVLDVMIHGWDALGHPVDGYDPWPALIDVAWDEWPALYQSHRVEIDAEAKRRGVATPWAAGI